LKERYRMPNARYLFKPSSVKRALMAARKAGFEPTGFTIKKDGDIAVSFVKTGAPGENGEGNDLDQWMGTHAHET
jgi:hypothetical protein